MKLMQHLISKTSSIVQHCKERLLPLGHNRVSTGILAPIQIEHHGSKSYLRNVSSISTENATTIVIRPFDKSIIPDIVKTVYAHFNIQSRCTKDMIYVAFPPLTTDRKAQHKKLVRRYCEDAKIAVRMQRRHALEMLKGLPQDQEKRGKKNVQDIIDQRVAEIDSMMQKCVASLQ